MARQLASPELVSTTIRTLSIDGVQKANSGHPGAPMGLAPVAWDIFSRQLVHNPADPHWADRDRFVLSAGHASMLIYSLLHLSGYHLSMDQLKAFRQLGSETPGHPERGDTPGVEITTGPLGQGFANAVGFALAERMLAARYNRPGHAVVDHRTWCICSDGDLMEGISHEAASLAGHLGLDRLVCVYDDNDITLDGPADLSFSEQIPGRFEAYGWRVLTIRDGNDTAEIQRVLDQAATSDGRPTLVRCHTLIGFGSPAKQGSSSSHGSPLGPEEVAATKRAYGWPEDAFFLVPDDVAAWADELRERGAAAADTWRATFDAYAAAFPAEAAEFARVMDGKLPSGWEAGIPTFEAGSQMATRAAGGQVINGIAATVPELIQGAADLSSSTSTTIKGGGDVARGEFAGRNIRYGVREHAMGAITNALAAHGGLRPVCSTFLTFSDYMKNTIRMAALMRLPSIFVFTHDSVALGEDGPTHQPVEHVAALRAIPNTVTLRPADASETAGAWKVAMERTDGPTVLILTRQNLPTMPGIPAVGRGAYVLRNGDDCILAATGSEVPLAVEAAELLAADGIGARVVSMPSWELFAAQDAAYRDEVLPPAITARVGVEAGASLGWHRWVGSTGALVTIDRFGVSAPGEQALEFLGVTAPAVAAAARDQMGR